MVLVPHETQIMPITPLHWAHRLQSMRFPPHFLHDSSGNSFRLCFMNFGFKA